jgi:phage tail P2-like protein
MSRPPYRDHLLPPNSSDLERALSAAGTRIFGLPVWIIRACWSPDDCPVNLLPYLAQAWSVDEWDRTWSEAKQRDVIKQAVWIHQHKATIGALKRAIAQLGLGARVVRWFEQTPRAAPYTFRLYLQLDAVTEWSSATARQLYRVAINNKAVRSLMDRLVLARPAPPAALAIGIAVRANVRLRLSLAPVTYIRARPSVFVGAGVVSTRHLRINPLAA